MEQKLIQKEFNTSLSERIQEQNKVTQAERDEYNKTKLSEIDSLELERAEALKSVQLESLATQELLKLSKQKDRRSREAMGSRIATSKQLSSIEKLQLQITAEQMKKATETG